MFTYSHVNVTEFLLDQWTRPGRCRASGASARTAEGGMRLCQKTARFMGNVWKMVIKCWSTNINSGILLPFPRALGHCKDSHATEFGDIRIRSSSRILWRAMAIGRVSFQIQSLLAASWSCCFYFEGETFEYPVANKLVPHDLYYLYCKADFHTIEGLVLFWHESVMSIAYFQIAEESSNCRNEKDYFPGFFNYPLLSQCNFTSVLLLSRLCRNWDKWSKCCSWRTLL